MVAWGTNADIELLDSCMRRTRGCMRRAGALSTVSTDDATLPTAVEAGEVEMSKTQRRSRLNALSWAGREVVTGRFCKFR